MEELAENEEILNEDFRFVSCDFRQSCGRAVEQGSPRFGLSLLAVSSRYGYTFAANQNCIAVYTLESTRDSNPCEALTSFTLDSVDRIFELQLLLEDRVLIAHAAKEQSEEQAELTALDVLKLVNGAPCRLSVLDGIQCSAFATFDSKLPLISVISSNRHIRTMELGPSSRELWIHGGDSFQSEAPTGLAFSSNGKEIAVCTRRGSIQILDARSGSRKGNVKEVESGWNPTAVFYVTPKATREKGLEELLVCYQNDTRLLYIIWQLDNGNVVHSSGLGELFFPDEEMLSNNRVRTYCEFIQDWDTLVLANSCSTETRLATQVDQVWSVWGLDEGKGVDFPLSPDGDQIFPTGFGLDYTDFRNVTRDDNRPPANPMPRFVALTSLDELWSVWIVDDRDGTQCSSMQSTVPIFSSEPLRLEPIYDMKKSLFNANAEPKSVSTPTASEENFESSVPASQSVPIQHSAQNLTGFSSSLRKAEEYNDPFANTGTSSFRDHRHVATSSSDTCSNSREEALRNSNIVTQEHCSVFSSVDFEGHATGATIREIAESSCDENTSASVDMSQPLILARNEDPANQLLSILEGMEREIEHVRDRKVEAEKAATSVSVEVEKKFRTIKDKLSSLIEIDTDYWEREKDVRSLVSKQLKCVIEVGQYFEELNLLNALLSENDDTRPLPTEVQAEDNELNRKENAFLERLDEVERKIEDRDPQLKRVQRSGRLGSGSEVSQHIYSSLTLQGVRIKRVRAVLDSLNSQLRCAMEEDENKPTNSNIPRSRLRRLSKHVPSNTPVTNRSSRFHKSGGSERRLNTMSDGVRGLSLGTSSTARMDQAAGNGYRSSQSKSSAIRTEAVRMLRGLAMRKGREKIIAKDTAAIAPPRSASNPLRELPSSGATDSLSKICQSTRPVTSHPTPTHAVEEVSENLDDDEGLGRKLIDAIPEPSQVPRCSASARSEAFSQNDEDSFAVLTSNSPLPARSPLLRKKSLHLPKTQPHTFEASLRFSQSTSALGGTTNTAAGAFGASLASDSGIPDTSFAKTFGQSSLFGNASSSNTLNFTSSSSLFRTSSHGSFGNTSGQSLFGANKSTGTQEDEPAHELKPTKAEEQTADKRDEARKDSTLDVEDESDDVETIIDEAVEAEKYPETPPETPLETPLETPTDTVDAREAPYILPQPSGTGRASLAREPKEGQPLQSEKPSIVASTVGLFGQAKNSVTDSASTSSAAPAPVSVFGASLGDSQSSASSLFGSGVSTSQGFSGFGAAAQTTQGTTSAFGLSTFGQSSFGQSAASFGQTASFEHSSSSVFGQSTSTFGQSSSAFGQSSSFEQSSYGQSMFGQSGSVQPSSFGQTSNTRTSALGSQPSASFGATSTFGIPASTPAFGAPSSFGANANPSAFGANLSGMQSAPLFGNATPTKGFGGFGGAGTPQGKQSPFGQVSSSGGGFGGFGTGGSSGSGSGQSPFGAVSGNQGGFGAATANAASGFGQTGSGSGFGGSGFGSGSGFGTGIGFGNGNGFGQSQSNQFKSESFTRRRA